MNDSISRKEVLQFLEDMKVVVPDHDIISETAMTVIECVRRFVTAMPPVYDWSPDTSNRCVCCGAIIPEGRMVCPTCERRAGRGNSN